MLDEVIFLPAPTPLHPEARGRRRSRRAGRDLHSRGADGKSLNRADSGYLLSSVAALAWESVGLHTAQLFLACRRAAAVRAEKGPYIRRLGDATSDPRYAARAQPCSHIMVNRPAASSCSFIWLLSTESW